jgi:hypothetical protein
MVPELMELIVMMEGEILELQGAENRKYSEVLKKIAGAKVLTEQTVPGGNQPIQPGQPTDMQPEMMSNQNNIPVQAPESYARNIA